MLLPNKFSTIIYNTFIFILITMSASIFTGCKTTDVVYRTDIEYVVVKPSNALLEDCAPLKQKEIKTNGDLATAYTELMFDYLICSNKIKTIKDFYREFDQKK